MNAAASTLADFGVPGGLELRHFVAPEIVLGRGALDLAGRHVAAYQGRKILLVTDENVRRAGWCGRVEESLRQAGCAYAIFDRLTPNPKDHEIMAGVDFYLRQGCDVLLAVGGGSVIDCAKCIGAAAANQRHILRFLDSAEGLLPAPPLICVPTTAGSGADVSQFAVVLDTRRRVKVALIGRAFVPEVTLVDPETTATLPPEYTAACGMDALIHALEAYLSNASSPITDLYALEAARLIRPHLIQAVNDSTNMQSHQAMMLGSLLGGMAFSNAGLGLIHAMGHAVGGLLDATHGAALAAVLLPAARYQFDAAPRCLTFLRAMHPDLKINCEDEALQALLDDFQELRNESGLPRTLAELGVRRSDLAALARNALQDVCLATAPVAPTLEDLEELFKEAYGRQ
jgi:alcohol dehydrogenase class IV